jgi:hypothetical protein
MKKKILGVVGHPHFGQRATPYGQPRGGRTTPKGQRKKKMRVGPPRPPQTKRGMVSATSILALRVVWPLLDWP